MENLRGAAFMVFAMLCFAIEDALIKLLVATLPVGQVLSFIALGGFIVFLCWQSVQGVALWQAEYLDRKVLLRSLCEVLGSCFFVTALALIPLTTASAVIQATPLVVAMGAAVFLGQAVGWRRWLAIMIGFAGVMVIIRPAMDGFQPATLLAVGGMLGLAARDLMTRGLTVSLSGVQLATHAFAAMVPGGVILLLIRGDTPATPDMAEWGLLACCVGIAIVAYLAILAATRTGNAGIISSFRYSRMVFALVIGFAFFAETPDAATLIGAAIIIGSGVYTLWREARLHRASLTAAATL